MAGEGYKKYKMQMSYKLDKIIQQNGYIITLLESVVDNSQLATDLQRRLNATNKALREIEYENWFKEHTKDGRIQHKKGT
jgi:hypothetical protein